MSYEEPKRDPNFIFKMERNIKAYMLYVIIFLSISIVSLAVALAMLMPLKETKPVLLKFSDADSRFVTISDTDLNVRNNEELLKSILAGYVKNREMINRIDDIERYNEIRTQSSREVWQAFENLVANPSSIYTTKNFYRDIKIINVAILSPNVATIDFQAEVSNSTRSEVSYKKYRSAVEYDFTQRAQTYSETMKKPNRFYSKKISSN